MKSRLASGLPHRPPSLPLSPFLNSMKLCTPSRRLAVAALLGFLAVALGAFGAHALKEGLAARGMTEVWKTAVLYHLGHAVVLLALAREEAVSCRVRACFVLGVVLFSGSLYLLAVGGPRWLGPVTPLGGLLLLAGWAGLCVNGVKRWNETK